MWAAKLLDPQTKQDIRIARKMWSRILKSEKGFDRVTSIQKLEQWYAKQCDGTWEHQRGIVIDTLDNPGWSVTIDLDGTDLEGIQMEPISSDNGEHDWRYCKIEGGKFIGHGDSLKLEVILEVFAQRDQIRGLQIMEESPLLRHFTAKLKHRDQMSSARM